MSNYKRPKGDKLINLNCNISTPKELETKLKDDQPCSVFNDQKLTLAEYINKINLKSISEELYKVIETETSDIGFALALKKGLRYFEEEALEHEDTDRPERFNTLSRQAERAAYCIDLLNEIKVLLNCYSNTGNESGVYTFQEFEFLEEILYMIFELGRNIERLHILPFENDIIRGRHSPIAGKKGADERWKYGKVKDSDILQMRMYINQYFDKNPKDSFSLAIAYCSKRTGWTSHTIRAHIPNTWTSRKK